jgi:hypothetical protein
MIRPAPLSLLILLATLLISPTAMAKNPPPEGRTYFVFIMGLDDDPYGIEADCLTFDATQACSPDGQTCMAWERTEGGRQSQKESGFSLATEIEDDGLIIRLDGQGRIDSRGHKSSISAVARAAALDLQLNFAFAGRQVGASRCRQMVEDFRAQPASP